ncbi:BZIP transcription factor [Rhynchospora pubera]|uniref:BZIP transcription factor n=1 Tax=Rhynchospora pubera TaxID=906938 RepID=A0AAV8F9N2_9POAL|nr:BZIP transcription factor [Rhynchospora pubera]
MEEVWNDLSLTTPSLSLHPSNATGYKTTTNTSSFSSTYQDFLKCQLNSNARPFSSDSSELKFALEGGITSASASASSGAAEDSGDRRRRRIMKNRESAARSRARKQAYTKQLQLEIYNLERENDKLKKQYEQLLRKMNAQAPQPTRNGVLQRTLSAPY